MAAMQVHINTIQAPIWCILTFSKADTAHPPHWIAKSMISQLSMPISRNVTWSMTAAEVANEAAAGLRNPRPIVAAKDV